MIRRLLLLSLFLVLFGSLGMAELRARWLAPLAIPQEGMILQVVRGESLGALADRLSEQGVLPHPGLLTWYGRWSGQDQRIKRGEYRVPYGTNAPALLSLLESGQVVQYQVTLPEGITLRQAIDVLHSEEAMTATLSGPGDEKILSLVSPSPSGEGWFFPDTYRYTRGDTDWQVLQQAHQVNVISHLAGGVAVHATSELALRDAVRCADHGIYHREGDRPGGRARANSGCVFVRRLQRGMRLQTDPTIIYGLGESI